MRIGAVAKEVIRGLHVFFPKISFRKLLRNTIGLCFALQLEFIGSSVSRAQQCARDGRERGKRSEGAGGLAPSAPKAPEVLDRLAARALACKTDSCET